MRKIREVKQFTEDHKRWFCIREKINGTMFAYLYARFLPAAGLAGSYWLRFIPDRWIMPISTLSARLQSSGNSGPYSSGALEMWIAVRAGAAYRWQTLAEPVVRTTQSGMRDVLLGELQDRTYHPRFVRRTSSPSSSTRRRTGSPSYR